MKVNKVAGNFHVAHGDSIVRDGRHIHMFNPADAPSYNISHTIHKVSFGSPYPFMPRDPLDGGKYFIRDFIVIVIDAPDYFIILNLNLIT